jgi:hypothetical protein
MSNTTEIEALAFQQLVEHIKALGFDTDNMTHNEFSEFVQMLVSNDKDTVAGILIVKLSEKLIEATRKLEELSEVIGTIGNVSHVLTDMHDKINTLTSKVNSLEDFASPKTNLLSVEVGNLVSDLSAIASYQDTVELRRQVLDKLSKGSKATKGLRRVVECLGDKK